MCLRRKKWRKMNLNNLVISRETNGLYAFLRELRFFFNEALRANKSKILHRYKRQAAAQWIIYLKRKHDALCGVEHIYTQVD